MRAAQSLFGPRRGMHMFFSLLCNTGGTEGQHNKATYCEVREGPYSELLCKETSRLAVSEMR